MKPKPWVATSCTIGLALLMVCQAGCLPQPTAHQMFGSSFTPTPKPPSQALWRNLRRHFRLPDASEQPEVAEHLQAYLDHPQGLMMELEQASLYLPYILNQTLQRGLPSELALLPFVESGYDPFAHSSAGAAGLWQMMPGTASGHGLTINWWRDERRDVVASTRAALDYLAYLSRLFPHHWLMAIAAYDSGEGRVQRALAARSVHHQHVSFWDLSLPKETQAYVPKLLALKALIAHPDRYGITLPDMPTPSFRPILLTHQLGLRDVARWSHLQLNQLRALNPAYRRWATDPQPHRLLLPTQSIPPFLHHLASEPKDHTAWRHHLVVPGDNLARIAHHHGLKVRHLVAANHLHTTTLQPGQHLLVPPPHASTPRRPPSGVDPTLLRRIAADHLPGPRAVVVTVQRGDSLAALGQRYHVTPQQLRYWNRLAYHVRLQPGQRLTLWQPHHHRTPHANVTVAVRSGDSLWRLAHRYHTTVAALRRLNHLPNRPLQVGQRVRVR